MTQIFLLDIPDTEKVFSPEEMKKQQDKLADFCKSIKDDLDTFQEEFDSADSREGPLGGSDERARIEAMK